MDISVTQKWFCESSFSFLFFFILPRIKTDKVQKVDSIGENRYIFFNGYLISFPMAVGKWTYSSTFVGRDNPAPSFWGLEDMSFALIRISLFEINVFAFVFSPKKIYFRLIIIHNFVLVRIFIKAKKKVTNWKFSDGFYAIKKKFF